MTTDEDLIEAALEQFALVGVRRTSADDIARRAGVNRATLYRRLGTMQQIVAASLLHEAARVIAGIDQEVGLVPEPAEDVEFDPADYVVRHFAASITALRENRLVRQGLLVDREQTLLGLTLKAAGVLEQTAALLADRIRLLRAWHHRADGGAVPEDDVAATAVTMARIGQSLVVTPDGPPRLETVAQMRAYAEAVMVPLVLR